MEEGSTHPEHILDWDPRHTAYNVSTSPRLLVVWCGNTVLRMIHVNIYISTASKISADLKHVSIGICSGQTLWYSKFAFRCTQ